MAASYIDATYVDAFISAGRRQKLFTDPAVGSYTASFFTQQVTSASELVKSAAKTAGYVLGDSTSDEVVKLATFGQLIMMAYGRKNEAVPEQFATAVNLAAAVRNGDLPLTSSPTSRDAVGGVSFLEQGTSERPAVFTNNKMRDVW